MILDLQRFWRRTLLNQRTAGRQWLMMSQRRSILMTGCERRVTDCQRRNGNWRRDCQWINRRSGDRKPSDQQRFTGWETEKRWLTMHQCRDVVSKENDVAVTGYYQVIIVTTDCRLRCWIIKETCQSLAIFLERQLISSEQNSSVEVMTNLECCCLLCLKCCKDDVVSNANITSKTSDRT